MPARVVTTPLPSLDYLRDTEGDSPGELASSAEPNLWAGATPGRCERVNFDYVNRETGELVPGGCHTYRCPYCGPRKTLSYQQAAASMEPERFVGLTLVPESFRTARKQLNDLASRIRASGYTWEWFWAIERNPAGTGYHLGAVQKGSYVPQDRLQTMWGDRIAYIEAIRHRARASAYVVKEAVAYTREGARSALDGYFEHLELNGGRGAHWSRGYFGKTVSEIVKEMRAQRREDLGGKWERVPRSR